MRSQKPSASGARSGINSFPSSSLGSRPRASVDSSNPRGSVSAVRVRAASAAYSSICPTMVRRISGLDPLLTSTSVGTASGSKFKWSTAHRAVASDGDSAIPCSRAAAAGSRTTSAEYPTKRIAVCCPVPDESGRPPPGDQRSTSFAILLQPIHLDVQASDLFVDRRLYRLLVRIGHNWGPLRALRPLREVSIPKSRITESLAEGLDIEAVLPATELVT